MIELFTGVHFVIQFFVICSAYYLLKFVLWYLPNRILRTINVLARGWPPEHLDADGDWPKCSETAQRGERKDDDITR